MESSGDSEITANQRYSGDDPVQSEPGRLQSARRTAAARAAGSRRTGIVSNLHGTITRRAYRLACQHRRSEEQTSELQSLMRISYAVLCLKKKQYTNKKH